MVHTPKRIQLVFANYHCAEGIRDCIAGIVCPDSVRLDVVVVENGGEPFPGVSLPSNVRLTVLDPARNVGYFGALRHAMERMERGYDYRVLCNPDIEFIDPTFFGRLAELSPGGRVAIIAPQILSSLTQSDQNPYLRRPPTKLQRLRWHALYAAWAVYVLAEWLSAGSSYLRSFRGSAGLSPTAARNEEGIYAPHGSLMIFSEAFVTDLALVEPVPFLFAEELYLGEICARADWRVIYVPALRVRHAEHATTSRMPSRSRFHLQRAAARGYLRLLGSPALPMSS